MQREIWPQECMRLHQEARTWLDRCANGDDDGGPVDLATLWPKWGRWLASLDGCVQKFHPGVTSFTAEFIAGTTDPNRGGRRRCDFCVRLTDGSYWRLHPGAKRGNSAKPLYFPAQVPSALGGTTSGAAEHACLQWARLAPDGVWSEHAGALVPPSDRLGKQQVWQAVAREADRIPWYPEEADVTDGRLLRWWLWVCNLARSTRQVTGVGITRAFLTRWDQSEYRFRFVRVDGSEAHVILTEQRWGGGSSVAFRVL